MCSCPTQKLSVLLSSRLFCQPLRVSHSLNAIYRTALSAALTQTVNHWNDVVSELPWHSFIHFFQWSLNENICLMSTMYCMYCKLNVLACREKSEVRRAEKKWMVLINWNVTWPAPVTSSDYTFLTRWTHTSQNKTVDRTAAILLSLRDLKFIIRLTAVIIFMLGNQREWPLHVAEIF